MSFNDNDVSPVRAKPLSEPLLTYCQLDIEELKSVKFGLNFENFVQENVFENVLCKIAAIFVSMY